MVAISARALAQSARSGRIRAARGGPLRRSRYARLAARRPDRRRSRSAVWQWPPLVGRRWTHSPLGARRVGIVCGTGFEDRPEFLDRLAERWPLLGKRGRASRRSRAGNPCRARQPLRAASRNASRCGPHERGWIAKRRRRRRRLPRGWRAGVRRMRAWLFPGKGRGRSGLGARSRSGRCAMVHRPQHAMGRPRARQPYRYGGAVRPAGLTEDAETAIADIARARRRGVASWGSTAWISLSAHRVAPDRRQPAPRRDRRYLRPAGGAASRCMWRRATAGSPRNARHSWRGGGAHRLCGSPKTSSFPAKSTWPEWAADRAAARERIDKRRPICTVLARAGTKGREKRLVETRKASAGRDKNGVEGNSREGQGAKGERKFQPMNSFKRGSRR